MVLGCSGSLRKSHMSFAAKDTAQLWRLSTKYAGLSVLSYNQLKLQGVPTVNSAGLIRYQRETASRNPQHPGSAQVNRRRISQQRTFATPLTKIVSMRSAHNLSLGIAQRLRELQAQTNLCYGIALLRIRDRRLQEILHRELAESTGKQHEY